MKKKQLAGPANPNKRAAANDENSAILCQSNANQFGSTLSAHLLNYENSLFRIVKPPAILPLQLIPSIPRQLQIAAVRAKTLDLRNRRLRAIDAEVANILSQSSLNDLLESWHSPSVTPSKTLFQLLWRELETNQ